MVHIIYIVYIYVHQLSGIFLVVRVFEGEGMVHIIYIVYIRAPNCKEFSLLSGFLKERVWCT